MTPALRKILLEDAFNPYRMSGNVAIYSVDGVESDATYLTNGLGRVKLIADRSGNSAVNCLVLNGASGNYASTPDAAPLDITASIDLRADVAPVTWTPSANQTLISKYNSTGNQRGYLFQLTTAGALTLTTSVDGTTTNTTTSSQVVSLAGFARKRVRVTKSTTTGKVNYYTSDDGTTWTLLGVEQSGSAEAIFSNSAALEIGSRDAGAVQTFSGQIFSAQVRAGIDGTIVFDADFTRVAKLAATFTESSANAATVTINTSGDLGARISGARDSVEFTATKIGLIATDAFGRNYLTLDGSNDYYKSAPFSLSQPETVYLVGSAESWTNTDVLFDGYAGSTAQVYQNVTTPRTDLYAGSNVSGASLPFAIGARMVVSIVVNGASSSMRVNTGSLATGNAGSANMGGLTLGASGANTNWGNITFSEIIIRSAADPEWLQQKIIRYLARKWAVAA